MFANIAQQGRTLWPVTAILAMVIFGTPNSMFGGQRVSQSSGVWSSAATWAGGITPQAGDTVIIASADSVYLDSSSAALNAVTIYGRFSLGRDTLFFSASPNDTLVQIFGTLDAGSGWFAFPAPVSPRPVIQVAAGGLFRMSSAIPFPTSGIFDSLSSPLFALDDSSTFEYYSQNLDLIDVSYLANNLVDHSYANLTLNGMDASFRSNPVRIRGTLLIDSGASIIAAARVAYVQGFDTQVVTISGDVVNQNSGESGSAGAGLRGCGMQSSGSEVWVFDRFTGSSGKDTCHWSGPSQLGSVLVRKNTVLSIRYLDDLHCDSLDILTHLTEENPPCGGHVIGKIYSEFPRTLDASNPVDSFYGLGLTIRTGTLPYIGRTRVVRVNGYKPPGARDDARPALRYFVITPGASPQQGAPDEMTFQLHCDELNGANPNHLHFWRSRDQGRAWAFSGISNFDPETFAFEWDTTVLGLANDSGSFYWMLSEGYTDHPTPIDLVSFSATRGPGGVDLTWETAAEINLAGFELDRGSRIAPVNVASFLSDRSLISQSRYGQLYSVLDTSSGPMQYDLYEVSNDGIRTWLAERWVQATSEAEPALDPQISIQGKQLSVVLGANQEGRIELDDVIGRPEMSREFTEQMRTIMSLPAGVYIARVFWRGGQASRLLILGE
ncbi:MAG: G8 domain-containing protein [Bacteroidota bacterium]|nr:G8 domain-containing protein [Bacteroidota bacterium]MDP4233356.1 G8 domain-containing protein [Bacteroidota bacterium]MDP4242223.1 G8 domain-containing protein [Bacteroidota bacterium]MDP4286979.1 G8 domain-containing protein [Bacteroidota bacterium]